MSYIEYLFSYSCFITVSLILILMFIIGIFSELSYQRKLKKKLTLRDEYIKSNIKVTHKPFN